MTQVSKRKATNHSLSLSARSLPNRLVRSFLVQFHNRENSVKSLERLMERASRMPFHTGVAGLSPAGGAGKSNDQPQHSFG